MEVFWGRWLLISQIFQGCGRGDSIRVVLAGIKNERSKPRPGSLGLTAAQSVDELQKLAETLFYIPCGVLVQERDAPDPATYLGKGKVEELASLIRSSEAALVIFDGTLSPVQAWNLQEATGVLAIGRTELILRIFASRARTREGKLQVELASARHALTRLTGHGREMSALGGGIGTRGPGEQRLETDRRLARIRISRLNKELKQVQQVRKEQRKKRKRTGIPLVSLVGYTNAGKSTLFSALTGEEAYCDDRLFATLDPWIRKWEMHSGQVVLLCDTVGFIQGLPHELVAAFRATLEESVDADMLIHVVDLSSPVWREQLATVDGVLQDLGADRVPRLTCFNKADLLEPSISRSPEPRLYGASVTVSALKGEGLEDLDKTVSDTLSENLVTVTWSIPYAQWNLVYEIRRLGLVLGEKHNKGGAEVTCMLSPREAKRLARKLRFATHVPRESPPSRDSPDKTV